MQKISGIVIALLLLGGAGFAQVPTSGNVFIGYSYNRANFAGNGINLNGWTGALEGKVAPFLGIVADISGQYGSGVSQHNVLFGPRVSASIGRIRPFAHVLIGVSHVSGGGDSDTSFGDAIGGGVDYKLIKVIAWRFQGDLLQTRFFHDTQNDFRFSTGVVLHF
ncbi:MAG TPA: hypothetical protein VK641_02950 [Terriglobales bacterium]|nr:hypothetical protein [Terriglobales bacterium]